MPDHCVTELLVKPEYIVTEEHLTALSDATLIALSSASEAGEEPASKRRRINEGCLDDSAICSSSSSTVTATSVTSEVPSVSEPAVPAKPERGRRRGQYHSRHKKNHKKDVDPTKNHPSKDELCPYVGRRGMLSDCQFNDKCKYGHSVDQYMTEKRKSDVLEYPVTIAGSSKNEMSSEEQTKHYPCPFFTRMGFCPYGLRCRLGGMRTHIEKSESDCEESTVWKSTIDLTKMNPESMDEKGRFLGNAMGTLNGMSMANFKVLKKCYSKPKSGFPKAWAVLSEFKKFDSRFSPSRYFHPNCVDPSSVRKSREDSMSERKEEAVQNDDEQMIGPMKVFEMDKQEAVSEEILQSDLSKLIPEQGEPKKDRKFPTNYGNALSLKNLPTSGWSDDLLVSDQPRKIFDLTGKIFVAPLTTVGNLPFRRIVKQFGADVTCSEMALVNNLLRGNKSEWALLKRHESEDCFGIQLAGGYVDNMTYCLDAFKKFDFQFDFIDLNLGCPLDDICRRRCGAGLMEKPYHLRTVVRSMYSMTDGKIPITVKMRKGYFHYVSNAVQLCDFLHKDGVRYVTVHGRSRQQRYRRAADWTYIRDLRAVMSERIKDESQKFGLIGNGDIFNWEEWYQRMEFANQQRSLEDGDNDDDSNERSDLHRGSVKMETCMLARGVLIKPWLCREIKERTHLDISAAERLDILRDFVRFGLEHWGSDDCGVEKTRKYLLEWLSFLHRYVPIGLLERAKVGIGEKPRQRFVCRNELETLMASANVADWVRLTEMLLGPVPRGFSFVPKHKASSYASDIGSMFRLDELGCIVPVIK